MTIYALATAPGRGAIAVVRVSGPEAAAALTTLAGPLPTARSAALRRLRAADGQPIDQALVLWFPAPASETGEDVAELHVHGGRAVIEAVLRALGAVPGLRPAEPGEFARRAFANGKLDLTAAEGLADLVAAETEAQRRQALRQLEGGLAHLYDGWRRTLIDLSARLEAAIDFPDDDLPTDLTATIARSIDDLAAQIRRHLDDGRRGERLREGFHVAIIGRPNVGKSSLLNRLARRDAAIVAPEPGTTRDVVEVGLDLDGLPVTVADTAGVRASGGAIEREGMRRAYRAADQADLKILIGDSEHIGTDRPDLGFAPDERTIVAINKCDRARPTPPPGAVWHLISCATEEGIDDLVRAVTHRLRDLAWAGDGPVPTRARHRTELQGTVAALDRAAAGSAPELIAEDLRLAARCLGRVTGRVDVEDVLDRLFAEFCIGK
jgi:tRNA modification GTPase